MSIVSFSKVSHEFLWEKIFDEISFTIDQNSRIGLIGKNGTGKTTIFNMINQEISPQSGEVNLANNKKISYLTQEPNLPDNKTLYKTVYNADKELLELKEKIKKTEIAVSQNASQKNLDKLNKLQSKFSGKDFYNYENKLERILSVLNFPKSCWQKKVCDFSGGEKSRIQLAKILLQPYDLLLLDEPTNHLDIPMIQWLEKYLKKSNKPYIIISHDRAFLDNTITKIFELKDGKIRSRKGNLTTYLEEKKKLEKQQSRNYKQQQKKIKKMKAFIRKNMAGQKVNQAKARQKELNKIEEVKKVKKEKSIKLNFQSKKRSGNDVFTFEEMGIGYENKTLAQNIDLRMHYQDKIALIGRNGSGKTTFLKVLTDQIKPLNGIVKKGAALDIGYYDQMHWELDEDLTVLETIEALIPEATLGEIYSFLAKFGFYEIDHSKRVHSLSGGEKSRLFLAKLIYKKPNFLILDEPTNHLDLDMINSLEKALINYDGTILFVSHDRYFIEKISDTKWVFKNNTIKKTEESIDEIFNNSNQTKKKKEKANPVRKKKKSKTNPILIKKKSKEIEKLHLKIKEHKELLEEKQILFSDTEFYKDQDRVKETQANIDQLKKEIKEMNCKLDLIETEYLEMLE